MKSLIRYLNSLLKKDKIGRTNMTRADLNRRAREHYELQNAGLAKLTNISIADVETAIATGQTLDQDIIHVRTLDDWKEVYQWNGDC